MKRKNLDPKNTPDKSYSFNEFLREFYPNRDTKSKKLEQDPKEFGKTLAEDAVKTIRKNLSPR